MSTADQQDFDPGYDIAAREAHVVGSGPRIAPLPSDALDEEAIAMVLAVRAGAGAGAMVEVPEYMRMMIRHPALFRCQMDLGAVLYNGLIPARERELAVLRVGWLCRAPYEWGQHVAIGKRVGLSDEEVARVRLGSRTPGWTTHEAAILRGVEELLDDKALSDATYATLAASWSEAQMIEFPQMVGQYVSIAFVQNSLRVPLEPGNGGLASV